MINSLSCRALESEILMLTQMLSEIPEDDVIDRFGLLNRLSSAKKKLGSINPYHVVKTAKITFNGSPVIGSHGIFADFASKATTIFSDAVCAFSASLQDGLAAKGKIPNKAKNRLLITGTAVGSFGFEFELPQPDTSDLMPEDRTVESAIHTIQKLLKSSANGDDEQVAEIIEDIEHRAVQKVSEFLEYLQQQQAWFGLEIDDSVFKFNDLAQVERAFNQLKDSNISESTTVMSGRFIGALPTSKTFEFEVSQNNILKGKAKFSSEDVSRINTDFLNKKVSVCFHTVKVGTSKPRHSLVSFDDVRLI
jgi:hypothetical protein